MKNASPGSLEVVDKALFVVCLDDVTPRDTAHLCENYLCGTYELAPADDNSTAGGGSGGARKRLVQVGSCLNRWYDKVSKPISWHDHGLTAIAVANNRLRRRFCWHQF